MGTSLPEKTSTIGKVSKEKSSTVPSLFNGISLLAPLKAPKSYGTYSKQQQEEVIAFIKEGNSLRTAEKFFGIPKSTMHCWLKKINNSQNGESNNNNQNNNTSNSNSNKSNSTNDALNTYTMANAFSTRRSPTVKTPSPNSTSGTPTISPTGSNTSSRRSPNSMTAISSTKTNSTGKKPQAQIIIEEAELIRFLQTGEGAELIGKAYNVPVAGFLDFVKNSQLTKKDTNQRFSGNLKNVDIASLLKQGATIKEEIRNKANSNASTTSNTNTSTSMYQTGFGALRKRNYTSSGCNCQSPAVLRTTKTPTITELKKPKLEVNIEDYSNLSAKIGSGSALEALLTKPRNVTGSTAPASNTDTKTNKNRHSPTEKPLFLTEEQIKTSSKLIGQAQPGVVNTYLVTVPLSNLPNNMTSIQPSKLTDELEECELSPTYPKSINPVSVKSEIDEGDRLMRPPSDCITFQTPTQHIPAPSTTKMQHLLSQVTKPVVTSNASAALNLNAINRTQSERELMALVGGDVVSADELCTDFKETLELNKWENWYTDQYLQHFQPSISPGCVLTSSTTSHVDSCSDTGLSPAPTLTPGSVEMLTPSPVAPSSSTILEETTVVNSSDDLINDEDEDDDGMGITFASNTDKDKIISYLAEGNSVADAERHFDIPQATINLWLSSINQKNASNEPSVLIQDMKQEPMDDLDFDSQHLHTSAFSHLHSPVKPKNPASPHKSAFCRK